MLTKLSYVINKFLLCFATSSVPSDIALEIASQVGCILSILSPGVTVLMHLLSK